MKTSQKLQFKNKFNCNQHTQTFKKWKNNNNKLDKMKTILIDKQMLEQCLNLSLFDCKNEIQSITTSYLYLMKKKCYPLQTQSNRDPTLFLTDYSKLSNTTFKNILIQHVTTDMNKDYFLKLFDQEIIITYVRQLTHLLNLMHYFQLQYQQWSYYYQLGLKENIWTQRIPKKQAQDYSLHYTYGRSKKIIQQRLNKSESNLITMKNNFDQYKMESSNLLLNIDQIIETCNSLIINDQYQLKIELERRRQMLLFDAEDHRLFNVFYKLKPRKTEIQSAKVIWRLIQDQRQLQYEIEMFKNWFSSKSTIFNCSFQDLGLTKISEVFSQFLLTHALELSNNVSSQYVDQLTNITNEILQNINKRIDDETNKLNHRGNKKKLIQNIEQIVNSIQNRCTHMIERAQYDAKQKQRIVFG